MTYVWGGVVKFKLRGGERIQSWITFMQIFKLKRMTALKYNLGDGIIHTSFIAVMYI